ncbi:MAG TPA: glycoside hydrolase family 88 protein [Tepidisphaeraceae bacterium]|nr:glycoside hydrolase family 88 protein [Tepidisphaeraceae bacterium]
MRMDRVLLACVVIAAGAAVAGGQAAPPSVSPQSPPQYPVPYQIPTVDRVTETLGRVLHRLESAIPPAKPGGPTDHPITFRSAPVAYPMGVIYAGMVSAADATGDKEYADFVAKRLQLYADTLASDDHGPVKKLLAPGALDDCGAIGSAFIKARRAGIGPDLKPVIDRFADYIEHHQLRLPDGTLARNRPFHDSIWGDDMYMSVPFLAQMGALSGDRSYFDDAVKQVEQISQHLWVPSDGLFTHAWNAENPDDHPHYYWGRANGWCMMATVELLSELPDDHPGREALLKILHAHAQTIATLQSGSGLWHQMLDRPDSYLETSASAMFTFAIARAVNRGWLDPRSYGPVAIAGWNGVVSRIDSNGCVSGTCIGTSYADDYIYYYHRPATDDIHGYGPVLLAGSEILRLMKNEHLRFEQTDRGNGPIYVQERPASGG